MGNTHRFLKLPQSIQKKILNDLDANGYSGYEGIEADLRAAGYDIGKSSIHRYIVAVRSDADFLRRWATENPALAAVLVAALKASPAGGIKLNLPAPKTRSEK